MAQPFVEGENLQIWLYSPDGQRVKKQSGRRKGENQSEADYFINELGYTTYNPKAGKIEDIRDIEEGTQRANLLFSFMPESVKNEFAKSWVELGDVELAKAKARTTPAWEKEFGFLRRKDGSLVMSEIEAVATKAAYRETLGEVGIVDTSGFEQQFEQMITGEVSAQEFQQRIDTVWNTVKNNIPQVEAMFRNQYNIDSDTPTIFAALINPEIQDKLLKGDLVSLSIGAEAKAGGFNRSFARFDALRKAGLDQKGARQLYQTAEPLLERAGSIGNALGIETLEAAAIGDMKAQQQVSRAQSEILSESSTVVGAAKNNKQVSGLLEQ